MQTYRLISTLNPLVLAAALALPGVCLADEATAPQNANSPTHDPNTELGAHFFVGRWACAGETRIPGLPYAQSAGHIQAEDHNSWTLDHFDATSAGITTHAKGWSTWDPNTKTLHRYATPFFGPSIHWVNHGGWDGDTLMFEAQVKSLFGLVNVWVLDVYTRAEDNRSFHHATYYAKNSTTWEAFYVAECTKTGGKTLP